MDPIKHFKSIIEAADTGQSVVQLKKEISTRINNLPNDSTGENTLHQVDDILVGASKGDRLAVVNELIDALGRNDKVFLQMRDKIARTLFSINATRAERSEFFELWKNDNLININVLLDPSKAHNLDEIVNGLDNPIVSTIMEFMKVTDYGIGKGELFLCTFSRKINRAVKGDLKIIPSKSDAVYKDVGKSGVLAVELKTRDAKGFRFFDRQVKPGPKWNQLCADFFEKYKANLAQYEITDSGINFPTLVELLNRFPTMKLDVRNIINAIIEDEGYFESNEIVNNLVAGEEQKAAETYTRACIQRYMDIKRSKSEDNLYGILAFDLPNNNSFFFTEISELLNQTLSIDAGMIYVISTHEQYPFPQTSFTRHDWTPNQSAAIASFRKSQEPNPKEPVAPVPQQQPPAPTSSSTEVEPLPDTTH